MVRGGGKYKKLSTDEQRLALAEERTLLSYVRTFFTVVGFMIILLKVYFETGGWFPLVVVFIASIALIFVIELIAHYRHTKDNTIKIDIVPKKK